MYIYIYIYICIHFLYTCAHNHTNITLVRIWLSAWMPAPAMVTTSVMGHPLMLVTTYSVLYWSPASPCVCVYNKLLTCACVVVLTSPEAHGRAMSTYTVYLGVSACVTKYSREYRCVIDEV